LTAVGWVANEFVYGGHMLAVGTASIAASFALILGVTPTPLLLLVAYLFSYGAYSINRSSDMAQDALSNPTRTHLLAGRRRYLPIIAMGCFALGYALAATVSTVSFTALLLPILLALAYSVGSKKLVPYLGVRRLKEKLLLKNLIVAFSWSLIPLLVAVYYFDLKYAIVTFGSFVFLRLMLNTIIFDVRDVAADRKFGVRTIPVVFGKSFSFRLMSLIDLATISYLVVALAVGLLPAYASIMIVLPLYSSVYRYLARRPEADLGKICDVIADGEYLLWGPIVFLGRILL
jgi:4-hydroxybenzoate polyprenyltransferase